MPKYLFLCRHAETASALPGQPDFDRTLTSTGIQDAQKAAHWIRNTGLLIPSIICSAAVRTQATARIFADILEVKPTDIFPDKSLYHASAQQLETHIGHLPASQSMALYVGHNPGISALVGKLNSRPGQYVPTAGVNLFTFDTEDWLELDWSPLRWQANY